MNTVTEEKTEISTIDKEIVAQKRAAWGNLGELIYTKEIGLQLRTQKALSKIKLPTKIEDVPQAELLLKEVKQEKAGVEFDRKSITSKFDDVSKRLMENEKSFDLPISNLTSAIISIKKQDEERQRLANKKAEALKACREFIQTTRNNSEGKFKQLIIDKVKAVYEWALGDGEIAAGEEEEVIQLALKRLTDVNFKIQYPLNPHDVSLVSTDEFVKMCNELLIVDPKPYLADYENQLRAKFSDYAVAVNNKAEALRQAELEARKKSEEAFLVNQNANAAAKLDAIAEPVNAVLMNQTKELKKSYEIDMEENCQSMIAIMTAFTAHLDLCLPKLKVNKWFSFTPSQAANALAKVKCDDNNFAPVGIKFKSVDKL